jgi:hypothetical protein
MEPHGQARGPIKNVRVGRHPGPKIAHGSLTPCGGASRQGSVFSSCALYPKVTFRPSTAKAAVSRCRDEHPPFLFASMG